MIGEWLPSPLLKASALLHGALLPLALARPADWRLWLALFLADHAAINLAGILPRSTWLGPNLSRLRGADEGRVALTFDDGPDPEVTPRVLDLLDTAGAKATFFVIGRRARRLPDLVSEIAARGHGVENHTQTHPRTFSFLSPAGQAREIDAAQETLATITGRRPTLFRAPAGIRNPLLEPVLSRRGLALVSWTRRGLDTADRSPERVLGRLTRGLTAGDILLLHDGNAARGDQGDAIVLTVLPRLMEDLDRQQLRSVPLGG